MIGHAPGRQPEQVVHSVGVVSQTVLLLQQLEGGHTESLRRRTRMKMMFLLFGSIIGNILS